MASGRTGPFANLCPVSVAQTLGVFLGIPLGIYAAFALLVYLPGATRRPRYRPGEPWPYEPVWYAPSPSVLDDSTRAIVVAAQQHRRELEGRSRPQLPPGSDPVLPAAAIATAKGGAHGEW